MVECTKKDGKLGASRGIEPKLHSFLREFRKPERRRWLWQDVLVELAAQHMKLKLESTTELTYNMEVSFFYGENIS